MRGVDFAGNEADLVVKQNITYDVTNPILTIDKPLNLSYINYNVLSYTLSEALANATLLITQTGGVEDTYSPQRIELIGKELGKGSFEELNFRNKLKLNNGSIFIDQLIINLGKLGAADVLGSVQRDETLTNFKFESNIFVDNQRKFISKFGIYNRKEIPANLFISGNFDFENIRASFYEISDNEKLNNDDVNFIEKELNDFMLSDVYVGLFNFSKFKEFIKSITSDIN